MTDESQTPIAPDADLPDASPPAEPEPAGPRPSRPGPPLPPPTRRVPESSADVRSRRPDYRGEELDPERGPGLGCFWFQVIVLGFFIVIIPVGLNLNWPFELLALLLFVVIGLLLLTGQSVIFLLRLVAADRRSQGRRRPLASTTKTVGELEDELGPADAVPTEVAGPTDGAPPAGEVAAAAGAQPADVAGPTDGAQPADVAGPAGDGVSPDGVASASPAAPGGIVAAAGMIPASLTAHDVPGGQPAAGELAWRAEGADAEGRVVAGDTDGGTTKPQPEPPDQPSADAGPESFRATEGTLGTRGPEAPDAVVGTDAPDEANRPAEPEPDATHASHEAEPEPEPDGPQEPEPGVRQ